MKISKNYRMKEFEVSKDYPHLIEKVPKELQCNVIFLVLKLLQPINDATGWINDITSGYRAPALNKAVGGVPTSQHAKGEASDNNFREGKIYKKPYEVASKVKELGLEYDQMILYNTFVHLSYSRDNNRNQLLYSKNYTGKRL